MLDRASRLSQYRVEWPDWNAATASAILRVLAVAVLMAGIIWWTTGWRKRRAEKAESPAIAPRADTEALLSDPRSDASS
jgi:hypothetical protein